YELTRRWETSRAVSFPPLAEPFRVTVLRSEASTPTVVAFRSPPRVDKSETQALKSLAAVNPWIVPLHASDKLTFSSVGMVTASLNVALRNELFLASRETLRTDPSLAALMYWKRLSSAVMATQDSLPCVMST